jgi:hypothetical protein
LVEGLRELIDESVRKRALGSYIGVASNATWMRQIVLTELPLAETGAVMRPGSDQRSHFITESANQTAAEAISIMLAFRPYRCLSQQSAPNGGSRLARFTGRVDVFLNVRYSFGGVADRLA